MNILLIGGSGSLINNLIVKLNKEGHRIYLLTGNRYQKQPYQKVFETYYFTYDCASLNEIFESINPDLTIFMGAYDTNFRWKEESAESVRYSAGLMNILMAFSTMRRGKFIYISSDEVYGESYEHDILETEPTTPNGIKGMTLAQAEEMCDSYRKNRTLDIVTLRLDHLYGIPKDRSEVRDICTGMCLEALEKNLINVREENEFSLLYEADAVEFIYRVISRKKHRHPLYNISSSIVMNQMELAELIKDTMGEGGLIIAEPAEPMRRVLSNQLYNSEFGNPFFCEVPVIVKKIVSRMKSKRKLFLNDGEEDQTILERFLKKVSWLFKVIAPFLENMLAFVPFFMLNNRAVGSEYFSNLDFYLLYVLLFAIVYGQQQATFSALLSVMGYCFRQMYDRSGFEVMLDANTYVWVAQLFILGLVVGYMRDQITKLKRESVEEREFITQQLADIQDINSSNVRVKDALETQIVNQNDSVGKIYSITSALDQYSPEEVLFYAAEMLGKLLKSKDVAIYTVANDTYARLFSSTSEKARMLGNSLRYREMGEMYRTLREQRVYINRKMDERYPLMANAIFEKDEMQMIVMIWGIPWESMTLGQANQLVVISSLIQNAVLRANRYMSALEDERYVEGTKTLDPEAFTALKNAYMKAREKGLVECTVLMVDVDEETFKSTGELLMSKLRSSDYIGTQEDGELYILLANTSREATKAVMERFAEIGFESHIVEGD